MPSKYLMCVLTKRSNQPIKMFLTNLVRWSKCAHAGNFYEGDKSALCGSTDQDSSDTTAFTPTKVTGINPQDLKEETVSPDDDINDFLYSTL